MFDFLLKHYEVEDITKYIRIVVFVGFYILFRQYYTNWSKNKQVKAQIAVDEKERAEKPEKDIKDKEELEQKLATEEANFGWGKKTRSRQKKAQAIVDQIADENRARYQSAYDAADDHDIDYLLED